MKINWKSVLKSNVASPQKPKLTPIFDQKKQEKRVLISIRDLKQVYGTKRKPKLIYDKVNLDIYENETLAILGANGAGKTTLVESIAGVVKPTSGTIEFKFNNNDCNADGYCKQDKVSVQFQDLSFPSGITIKDILSFIIEMNDSNLKEEDISLMLKKFQLKDFLNLQAKKLSGGQQQRLNVMIAMLSKPKILFLDEFTTGLDIDVKNQIKDFIVEFSKKHNIMVVIISHDVEIIDEMSDRIVVIAEQKIMVDAYRETLIKKFGSISEFLKKYIV